MIRNEDPTARKTVEVAERVGRALAARGLKSAVIGAMALSVHHFPRYTEDFDIATFGDPYTTLRAVAKDLSALGYEVAVNDPDLDDPLGGVMTVTGSDFLPVQVVNYYNPHSVRRNPGFDALESAIPISGTTDLKSVDLPHLIALKLYAGGEDSRSDVRRVLRANPDADMEKIRRVCEKFHLSRDLDATLASL